MPKHDGHQTLESRLSWKHCGDWLGRFGPRNLKSNVRPEEIDITAEDCLQKRKENKIADELEKQRYQAKFGG